jgi:hypothetical protein
MATMRRYPREATKAIRFSIFRLLAPNPSRNCSRNPCSGDLSRPGLPSYHFFYIDGFLQSGSADGCFKLIRRRLVSLQRAGVRPPPDFRESAGSLETKHHEIEWFFPTTLGRAGNTTIGVSQDGPATDARDQVERMAGKKSGVPRIRRRDNDLATSEQVGIE